MIQLTQAQLLEIFPNTPRTKLLTNLNALNAVLKDYEINTSRRVAEFLGQLGVESGDLFYTKEIWGPTAAQKRYDTRTDLGNTPQLDGDGELYMGRGWIQTTGKDNYELLSKETGIDFVNNPELLEQLPYAATSAGQYWKRKKLNAIADKGGPTDGSSADCGVLITYRVNGGYTHLSRRLAYRNTALRVLTQAGYPIEKKKIELMPLVIVALVLVAVGIAYWKRNNLLKWIQEIIPSGLRSQLQY